MNRGNSFSLTIMVIIMALLAIFVGYLLGNWLIQMVTGDTTESQQVARKRITEEETVEDNDKNEQIKNKQIKSEQSESEQNFIDNNKNTAESEQLKGDVYVVQVGAFENQKNAMQLKEELGNEGFQVVVTDTVPYKVQLGATNDREEAEETEKVVENLGFDAFITQ